MPQHPELEEKLRLLYGSGLNATIDKHSKLARELGIARQNISKWIKGTDTHQKGTIPRAQLDRIAALFSIEPGWLRLPVDEFERRVQRRLKALNLAVNAKEPLVFSNCAVAPPQRLIGRDEEMSTLGFAWAHQRVSCVHIHGFGGIGKTALLDTWFVERESRHFCGAELVFSWSFSQSENLSVQEHEAQFLNAAMSWLGLSQHARDSAVERAKRICEAIGSRRTLLILDGLEVLQRIAGGRGVLEAAGLQHLIVERMKDGASLLVLSARLAISPLQSAKAGRVLDLALGGLKQEEGIEFFEERGILVDPFIAQELNENFCGHPLLLKTVAEFSELSAGRGGRSKRGYVDYEHFLLGRHSAQTSLIELSHDSREITHQSLGWCASEAENELLEAMALVGGGITLSELTALLGYCATQRQEIVRRVVRELVRAHLLIPDTLDDTPDDTSATSNTKDSLPVDSLKVRLQPLLSQALIASLQKDKTVDLAHRHSALFEILVALAEAPDVSIEAKTRLYLLASEQGVQAGRVEEAYDVYFRRLRQGRQLRHLGNKKAERRTLMAFFERDWDTALRQLPALAQARMKASAAMNLMSLGLTAAALVPATKSVSWLSTHGHHKDALQLAGALLSMLVATGQLARAQSLLKELAPLGDSSADAGLRCSALSFSGYVAFLNGQIEEARRAFAESEAIIQAASCEEPLFPAVSTYYVAFLLETGKIEEALSRSLQTASWRETGQWQTKVDFPSLEASDLLVMGLAYLHLGSVAKAEEILERQLSILIAADERLYLPAGFIARAQLNVVRGAIPAAIADLSEALGIAESSGAVLSRIDALLCFARLHSASGNSQYARAYIAEAKQLSGTVRLAYYDEKLRIAESEINTLP
jgi:tetratricopeptide (TPR) repeat protein/transcriptional regulator with XRE-family HTH domain